MTIDAKEFTPPADPTGKGYVYDAALIRAIRVALATARPLLLRGAPGCGKTTLARDVARQLRADYYYEVVTSRTEARDLEWRFDAVLRLAEAQIADRRERVAHAGNYVEPRALWWGFDPAGARLRGGGADSPAVDPLATETSIGSDPDRPAVILIDEIDKAEPEVANDLLEPFDVATFTVAETGTPVGRKRDVFLVVTTNEERDLPAAFLRRCVVHELERPAAPILRKIAASHFGDRLAVTLVDKMIERIDQLAAEAKPLRLRAPGTAEFIDALEACRALGIEPAEGNHEWTAITRLAMWKHPAVREDQS
jgi:MoxR-like ATPase